MPAAVSKIVEKRQEVLRSCERQPRKYVKRNSSFWYKGGKQESARKVPRISTVEQEKEEIAQAADGAGYPQQQKAITQSANDLKKLKVTDLVQLLADLTGHQPSLPKKQESLNLFQK